MPRNKDKKQQPPPQAKARSNRNQQNKARQRQARNVGFVAGQTQQIQRRKARNTLSISGAMSGAPIGNAGLSLWRASLLDPFNTPGAQCTGDFFVRGAVPYTVKKNFQLSTAGLNYGSIVVFPNLTTMVWNPDTSFQVAGGMNAWLEATTAPVTTAATDLYPPFAQALSGGGISLPQLNTLFSKYRIVSMGIRIKCDASLNNTSGKMTVVTMPYTGLVPVASFNTVDTGVYVDNPYTTASAAAYGDQKANVYTCHPNSALAYRTSTPGAILRSLGLQATAGVSDTSPIINSAQLTGLPFSEVVTMNEINGRNFEVQPRPCDASLWEWKSTGISGSASNAGTSTESVYLDRGSDAFPGCLVIVPRGTASVGSAAFYQVDANVNISPLQASGFEATVISFSGLPTTAAFADLELVYNIECIPAGNASGTVAGIQASARVPMKARGASRDDAHLMLQQVSATPDKMVTSIASSVGGIAGSLARGALNAATSGAFGIASDAIASIGRGRAISNAYGTQAYM